VLKVSHVVFSWLTHIVLSEVPEALRIKRVELSDESMI